MTFKFNSCSVLRTVTYILYFIVAIILLGWVLDATNLYKFPVSEPLHVIVTTILSIIGTLLSQNCNSQTKSISSNTRNRLLANVEKTLANLRYPKKESLGERWIQVEIKERPDLIITHLPDSSEWDNVIDEFMLRTGHEYTSLNVHAIGTVRELFKESNNSLLIVGKAGSGKSYMLSDLAYELIEKAKEEKDSPVPVYLSLSSWGINQNSLMNRVLKRLRGLITDKEEVRVRFYNWVVSELKSYYNLPEVAIQRLLEEDKLVLLLDGLDEISTSSLMEDCVLELNKFYEQYSPSLAVCSRIDQYQNLPNQIKLNFGKAIYLQELEQGKINKYFSAYNIDSMPIRRLLGEKTFNQLVQTPLMLFVMSEVFSKPQLYKIDFEFTEDLETNIEKGRKFLFDSYIDRMFLRRDDKSKDTYLGVMQSNTRELKEWLAWLSKHIERGSSIQVESIQPSFLPTMLDKIIYVLGSRIIAGLAVALATSFIIEGPEYIIVLGAVNGLSVGLIDLFRLNILSFYRIKYVGKNNLIFTKSILADQLYTRLVLQNSIPAYRKSIQLIKTQLVRCEVLGKQNKIKLYFFKSPLFLLINRYIKISISFVINHWSRFDTKNKILVVIGIWAIASLLNAFVFRTLTDIRILSLALAWGFPYALIFGFRNPELAKDIKLSRTIKFYGTTGATSGFIIGWLTFGIIAGPMTLWIYRGADRITQEMITQLTGFWLPNIVAFTEIRVLLGSGLLLGFIVGGPIGTIFGLQQIEEQIIEASITSRLGFNTALRAAIISALRFGIMIAFTSLVMLTIIYWDSVRKFTIESIHHGLVAAIRDGMAVGIYAACWFGIIDVIQHCILRIILYWRGFPTLRVENFFDQAEELILLRWDNRGYRFFHELLQDHFAITPLSSKSIVWKRVLKVVIAVITLITMFYIIIGVTPKLFRWFLLDTTQTHPSAKQRIYNLQISEETNCNEQNNSILIEQGDIVHITSMGRVRVGFFMGRLGPEGTTAGFLGAPDSNVYDIQKEFPHGSLMCRIHNKSMIEDLKHQGIEKTQNYWDYFGERCAFRDYSSLPGALVPQRKYAFEAKTNGCLEFNINDKEKENNSGAFDVVVTIEDK